MTYKYRAFLAYALDGNQSKWAIGFFVRPLTILELVRPKLTKQNKQLATEI